MTYQEIVNSSDVKELNKILPVVQRVHSGNHPELSRVGEIYSDILKGAKSGKSSEEIVFLAYLNEIFYNYIALFYF